MNIQDYNKATAELKKFNRDSVNHRITYWIIPEICRVTVQVFEMYHWAMVWKRYVDQHIIMEKNKFDGLTIHNPKGLLLKLDPSERIIKYAE